MSRCTTRRANEKYGPPIAFAPPPPTKEKKLTRPYRGIDVEPQPLRFAEVRQGVEVVKGTSVDCARRQHDRTGAKVIDHTTK